VCTGSLIFAAAGLLEGRNATTHWALADQLNRLGAQQQRQRWVQDGTFLCSAGVSAGIDMALHLAAELTNEQPAKKAQLIIEYDPQPPSAGSTGTRPTSTSWPPWSTSGSTRRSPTTRT